MSEPIESPPPPPAAAAHALVPTRPLDGEELDMRRDLPGLLPAAHAAAVAAGSFAAGAALVGLIHRRRRRTLAIGGRRRGRARRGSGRSRAGGPRAAELIEIVASRSLLVDVHLLGGAGQR